MGKKRKKDSEREQLKLEIAAEIGLLEKIKREGWKNLSAADTGRIGGLLLRRLQKEEH